MKKPIHKGDKTFTGVYNRCNGNLDASKFSLDWGNVTCYKCLAKRRTPEQSFIGLNNEYRIIGEGTFLEGLRRLKKKACDAIFGPQGGILILSDRDSVTYRSKKGIFFSVDNYLGKWRFLAKPKNE